MTRTLEECADKKFLDKSLNISCWAYLLRHVKLGSNGEQKYARTEVQQKTEISDLKKEQTDFRRNVFKKSVLEIAN